MNLLRASSGKTADEPASLPGLPVCNTPLLPFADQWELLNTKDLAFEKLLPTADHGDLQIARELDCLRRSTCVKQSIMKDRIDDFHLDRMAEYVIQLHKIIPKLEQEVTPAASSTSYKFEWTAPLTGKGNSKYKLPGLKLEQAMAAFQFAGALRAHALVLSQQQAEAAGVPRCLSMPARASTSADVQRAGVPSLNSAGEAQPLVEAATSLRRAAGVLQWLAERALPMLHHALPSDRPVELLPPLSLVMHFVALGEAQAVTAQRAGQRRHSPALVAALHAGASELFERAARTLKSDIGVLSGVSDRLRRFLAISAALQRARAFRFHGEDLCSKEQAGQGEAACVEADRVVANCMAVAEGDATWQALLRAEQAEIEETRKRIEKDRSTLYMQVVAKTAPDPPAAKVLVKAIPFDPSQTSTGAGL